MYSFSSPMTWPLNFILSSLPRPANPIGSHPCSVKHYPQLLAEPQAVEQLTILMSVL